MTDREMLELAEQLPISINTPPAKPAFTASRSLTVWGWAWAIAAVLDFVITVYLKS